MQRLKQNAVLITCLAMGLSVWLAPAANAITFVQWSVGSGGNDHYYGVTDATSDWNTAEATAISLGGHLASITSLGEQSFINTTFLVGFFDLNPLWVGLSDASVEGSFVWTTGESLSFANWHSGEPNNLGNEDYVAINWHRAADLTGPKGDWNDTPLNGSVGYGGNSNGPYFGVVEVVPEPSPLSLTLMGVLWFGLARARRRS